MKAFIIEFNDPIDFVSSYRKDLQGNNFVLSTRVPLMEGERVKLRFNLPEGTGVTLTGKIIGSLEPGEYMVRLPHNADTEWLKAKGSHYSQKYQYVRVPEEVSLGFDTKVPTGRIATNEPSRPGFRRGPFDTIRMTRDEIGVGPALSPEDAERTVSSWAAHSGTNPGLDLSDFETAQKTMVESTIDTTVFDEMTPPFESFDVNSITPELAPDTASRSIDSSSERHTTVIRRLEQQQLMHPSEFDSVSMTEFTEDFQERFELLSPKMRKQRALEGDLAERDYIFKQQDVSLQLWVLKNPNVTLEEARWMSAFLPLSESAIDFFSTHHRWSTDRAVAINLIRNPSTPLDTCFRLLFMLNEDGLKQLIDTEGVRQSLVAKARKLLIERSDDF